MLMFVRIGVFICQCGGNISNIVNVELLQDGLESMPNVERVILLPFLCSDNGLNKIKESIRSMALERIVVAACSPLMYEELFRRTLSDAGLNPYLLEWVNVREQCSFVHRNRGKATSKALDLILGGLNRARELKPLVSGKRRICKQVLVVGGGIAGVTSSLLIAEFGYPVILVEEKPSIGGHMAQLSKTFPTFDCSLCMLSPRMHKIAETWNVTLLTQARVEGVEGDVGGFRVELDIKPRGVDVEKCIQCGKCVEVCPVVVKDEFEEEMYSRRAIYLPFSEAFPPAYVVDFEHCTRCDGCVEVCPTDAVNLDDRGEKGDVNVGAIVVATGFDLIDLDKWRNLGFGMANVVTALQMERLISNELGSGKVLRREDGERVKSLAYILCVGSRDVNKGVPYCSKICCPYTIKQAILLKKALPYLKVWIYFTDIRASGRGLEELWAEAREIGIIFVRGKPGEVKIDAEKGKLEIIAEDRDLGRLLRNRVDMVVLAPALVPSRGTRELARRLGVSLKEDFFIAEKQAKINPLMTDRAGIFAAGACLGPKDIREVVAEAEAAAANVVSLFKNDELILEAVRPVFDGALCVECGACVAACPYNAVKLRRGEIVIDYANCNGCGACVAVCEENALDMAFYTKKQIEAQVKGILSFGRRNIQIIGFLSDGVAYKTVDALGTRGLAYPESIRMIRVPSTALISPRLALSTLAWGADGLILIENGDAPEAKITGERVRDTHELLFELGVERIRVGFEPTTLPSFRVLAEDLVSYASEIEGVGKLSLKNRGEILSKLGRIV